MYNLLPHLKSGSLSLGIQNVIEQREIDSLIVDNLLCMGNSICLHLDMIFSNLLVCYFEGLGLQCRFCLLGLFQRLSVVAIIKLKKKYK